MALGVSLTRRAILSVLGASSLSLFGRLALPALARNSGAVSPAFPVIDAHCHVFNASDLPVRGCLPRVMVGDVGDQVIFDPDPERSRAIFPWLGATLLDLLLAAPDAAGELAILQRGPEGMSPAATLEPGDVRIERVRGALQNTLATGSQSPDRARRMFPSARSAQGREAFLQKIQQETAQSDAAREMSADARPFGAEARALLSGRGVISRHFQWADLLTSYRSVIVRRLADLYDGVTLFTPALIDFSAWLEDEPRSGIEDQIKVMERIQRLGLKTPVHCLAPFDPWRQLLDEEEGRSPTALDLVKWAVMEMGFVGVKLYPPMGFLPTGNAGSGLPYPQRAGTVRDFPERIDQALNALYAWAEQNDVAVMAHATDSNGAADGYSSRAHPKGWSKVLTSFPRLRLNLAHFGGFDEQAAAGSLEGTWEQGVADLLNAGAEGLYADLSYLSEMLPDAVAPEHRDRIRQSLQSFVARFDPELTRLVYGSDWNMIARERKHAEFLAAIQALLEDIGANAAQRRRFFGANAARFLGLREGDKTRIRLEAYYRRKKLDPKWLRMIPLY